MSKTALEDMLLFQCRAVGLPEPEREVKLIDGRKWRVDFLWRPMRTCVEVDGGTWGGGRHTTGTGFMHDCEKINALQLSGYVVLRFVNTHVESGDAVKVIEQMLR